jgi:hypothetical protein
MDQLNDFEQVEGRGVSVPLRHFEPWQRLVELGSAQGY